MCPDYTISSEYDFKECVDVTCPANQVVNKDGTCSACDLYTKPSNDGKECIADNCTEV